MKILQFFNMNSNKYGGLETFFIKLVEKSPNNKFYFCYNNLPKSNAFLADCKRLGIEIIVSKHSGSPLNDIKNSLWFYKMVKRINPDIIHFHFGAFFNIYTRIARLLGVKYIYKTMHSCIVSSNMVQYKSYKQLPFKHRILLQDPSGGYSDFDKIICVGHYVKDQFGAVYKPLLRKANFDCQYFGVDKPKSFKVDYRQQLKKKLEIKEDQVVLCTVLFASPIKGLDILLNAVNRIKDLNIAVIIVGIDEKLPSAKKLHHIASTHGIEEKLRWIGITDNVSDYLSISDIYIQPSRTEALPFAACEALSYNLPVVGSDVGGLPEVSSLLFPLGNDTVLADDLRKLINDRDYRQTLSIQAKNKFDQTLDINLGVDKYIELYAK